MSQDPLIATNGIKHRPKKGSAASNGHVAANGHTDHKLYPIITIEDDKDDTPTFPEWKRRAYNAIPWLHSILIFLLLCVACLRYKYTRDAQKENGFAWLPWIIFWAEILDMSSYYLDDIRRLFTLTPPLYPPRRLRLAGDDVPTVDIIITSCRENPSILLDTARAACILDYPTQKYRVIVSDDGADPRVAAQVDELKEKHPHLYYFPRDRNIPGKHHGFKAGNINAALRHTSTLKGGAAVFFAVLDVDMIPEPALLRALLAHVVNDPRMAMASLPQYFYNQPVNDPLLQSHTVGNKFDEVIRSAVGASWCSGTGFVARAAAIADVGGFSETTLAEDILCSMMLYGKGWKVHYVQEQLQWGIVPPDLTSHVKQRTKWHIGAMQNSLRLRFCLSGPLTRGMTLHQRSSGMSYCVHTWSSTLMPLPPLLIFPICLLFNHDLVSISSPTQLQHVLSLSLLATVIARLNEYLSSFPTGYRTVRRHEIGQLWLREIFIYNMVRELLPLRWGGRRLGFTPSGSVVSAMNERNAARRAPLTTRLRVMIVEYGLWFHLTLLLLIITAISTSIFTALTQSNSPAEMWRILTLRILWPWIPWKQFAGLLAPVVYTIWPPSVLERRELMEQESGTGVWRAKKETRGDRYDKWIWGTLIVPVGTVVVHMVVWWKAFDGV